MRGSKSGNVAWLPGPESWQSMFALTHLLTWIVYTRFGLVWQIRTGVCLLERLISVIDFSVGSRRRLSKATARQNKSSALQSQIVEMDRSIPKSCVTGKALLPDGENNGESTRLRRILDRLTETHCLSILPTRRLQAKPCLGLPNVQDLERLARRATGRELSQRNAWELSPGIQAIINPGKLSQRK